MQSCMPSSSRMRCKTEVISACSSPSGVCGGVVGGGGIVGGGGVVGDGGGGGGGGVVAGGGAVGCAFATRTLEQVMRCLYALTVRPKLSPSFSKSLSGCVFKICALYAARKTSLLNGGVKPRTVQAAVVTTEWTILT